MYQCHTDTIFCTDGFKYCELIHIWIFLLVSKPAPDWNGTAVINGEIKDIKLADFRGKWIVFFFYPLDL